MLFWLLVALVLAAWLSRYRYSDTQTRTNRFTGQTERRIAGEDGSAEWVPLGDVSSR